VTDMNKAMDNINSFKWIDDYLMEPAGMDDGIHSEFEPIEENIRDEPVRMVPVELLEEAKARIQELEQAVEFWKQSFNYATEDYQEYVNKYNDLLLRTASFKQ
jgi:hypothetical protein